MCVIFKTNQFSLSSNIWAWAVNSNHKCTCIISSQYISYYRLSAPQLQSGLLKLPSVDNHSDILVNRCFKYRYFIQCYADTHIERSCGTKSDAINNESEGKMAINVKYLSGWLHTLKIYCNEWLFQGGELKAQQEGLIIAWLHV